MVIIVGFCLSPKQNSMWKVGKIFKLWGEKAIAMIEVVEWCRFLVIAHIFWSIALDRKQTFYT